VIRGSNGSELHDQPARRADADLLTVTAADIFAA
jgi:hypothetical protein